MCFVALLQRIDDPSGGIRILATSVIPYLRPIFGAKKNASENDEDVDKDKDESSQQDQKVWEHFLKYCMDLLYLHYDGPDVRLQQAIKGKSWQTNLLMRR